MRTQEQLVKEGISKLETLITKLQEVVNNWKKSYEEIKNTSEFDKDKTLLELTVKMQETSVMIKASTCDYVEEIDILNQVVNRSVWLFKKFQT